MVTGETRQHPAMLRIYALVPRRLNCLVETGYAAEAVDSFLS